MKQKAKLNLVKTEITETGRYKVFCDKAVGFGRTRAEAVTDYNINLKEADARTT